METGPVMIVSGTNRPDSNTLRVARVIQELYNGAGRPAELFSLSELPPEAFLPTVYAEKPAAVMDVQERVVRASGLHVVTPEYNGSFPGLLKHFIDLLKFPDSFEAKPVAFVGLGAGGFAGVRPVEQLQMVFAYRNAHVFPDRVFLPSVRTKLGPDGRVNDAAIQKRLTDQVTGFCDFIRRLKREPSGSAAGRAE